MAAAIDYDSDYQPFGIHDYRTGLSTRREPWLSQTNAWETLENGFVFRGRLSKRPGYQIKSTLGIAVAGESWPGTQVVTAHSFGNAFPMPAERAPSTYRIEWTDAGSGRVLYDQPIDFETLGLSGLVQGIICEDISAESVGVSGSTHYTGTFANLPFVGTWEDYAFGPQFNVLVLPSRLVRDKHRRFPTPANIVFTDGTQTITCTFGNVIGIQANGTVIYDCTGDVDTGTDSFVTITSGGSYTYDITFASSTTGAVTVDYPANRGVIFYGGFATYDWDTAPTGAVTCDYEYRPRRAVMGIKNYFDRDGSEFLIAMDTVDVWEWNTTLERFERMVGASPVFTGEDTDFPWFVPFEDVLLITNGIDHPKKYDGGAGTIADWGTTYNPDTGDEIEAARIAVRDRNRIVYFWCKDGPTGSGTQFRNRGRWTPPNSVEYSGATAESEDDFIDAPTEDNIVTAFRVGDDIIVGMDRSWWRFRYDGNEDSPYVWEQILGEEGAVAKMAFALLPEQAIARGEKAIVGIDGVSERPIDAEIPDLSKSWNQGKRNYSYSFYSKENREILMTYVDVVDGSEKPEHVLSIHVSEDRQSLSFSTYTLPFHCFGEFRSTFTRTHDNTPLPHDSIEWSYDEAQGVAGTPTVLAGDRESYIHEFAVGVYDDDGDPVKMTAKTKRLNPYVNPSGIMQKCHLGYVDLTMDGVYGESATVNFYSDFQTGPYQTSTVDLTPASSSRKVSRRLLVNRIANYHQIEIVVESENVFNLDAITLWAKPAGPMEVIA